MLQQSSGSFGDEHLNFRHIFLGVALQYHARTFEVNLTGRQPDLVVVLTGKLGDLFVGCTNLVIWARVDQRDTGATGEFLYFNVTCAFAFADWHANVEACAIFFVLGIMMQD